MAENEPIMGSAVLAFSDEISFGRRTILIFGASIFACGLLGLALAWHNFSLKHGAWVYRDGSSVALFTIIALLAVLLISIVGMLARICLMYADFRRYPAYFREQHFEVDQSALKVRNGRNLVTAYPWSAFERGRLNTDLMSFKLAASNIWITVPRRAFEPEQQDFLIACATNAGVRLYTRSPVFSACRVEG